MLISIRSKWLSMKIDHAYCNIAAFSHRLVFRIIVAIVLNYCNFQCLLLVGFFWQSNNSNDLHVPTADAADMSDSATVETDSGESLIPDLIDSVFMAATVSD